MASLVNDDKVAETHKEDGSKLLELNKISVDGYLEDQNHIAKMRSLLFCHEMKRKCIKKIRSKTYHRILKKNRLKGAYAEVLMDLEAMKEEARKQEFKRAEERMTLKHKNSSKWAKRILQHGLNAQDEGTWAAIAAQLHQHALLARKTNTSKDNGSCSGSDDSSDGDDVDRNSTVSDEDEASKLFAKAKEKTLEALLEDEDEVPSSGVLSVPFMVQGLKKRKDEAIEEAKLALQEYDSSLKELEGTGGEDNSKVGFTGGRRVFGAAKREVREPCNQIKMNNYYGNSSSEDDQEAEENVDVGNGMKYDLQKDVNTDSILLHEDPDIHQDSVFKVMRFFICFQLLCGVFTLLLSEFRNNIFVVLQSFDEVVKDPGPKTSYDVSIFALGTRKKIKSGKAMDTNINKSKKVSEPVLDSQELKETVKEVNEETDTVSEGQMVDGILSSEPKASYKLPSQEELIRLAFVGDDVEKNFRRTKKIS